MGYTHYWTGCPRLPADLITDIRKLLAAVPEVKIRGPDGGGDPVICSAAIELNGDDDQGAHEPLVLSPDRERGGFGSVSSFCKTARKPYDLIVCAVLLRVAYYNPEFDISSDGAWKDEWVRPRELYERVFETPPEKPKRIPNGDGDWDDYEESDGQ